MNKNQTQAFLSIREERYQTLKRDYLKIIREAVAHFGSTAELSRQLGRQERYIANAMNDRGTGSGFKAMRNIATQIGEIL